jgi:hypothetical protein
MTCFVRPIVLLALIAQPLAAQHPLRTGGQYDPSVPTPRSVLGYEIGEQFTPHHLVVRYVERLAAASRRVHVDTVARSFEGREMLNVVITSEANQQRREQLRADAVTLSDPVGTAAAQSTGIAARLPVIVWLGHTVHGNEASGAESALALMYQLAAGQDAETRMILDSVIVLIDPLQNPDGHERHVHDVQRARGAFGPSPTPGSLVHAGSWPGPRTSHYYFDMNRDWFTQSHPETRGRIATMLRWRPHVAVDLHEMGSSSSYFFPPPMAPVNKNVHATVVKWWDIFGDANAAAFDANGWSYFRREGYDAFFAGFGDSWPFFNGAIGMTYEQASSGGGAIRRPDGTILTLREAASHHYTASWATLMTSARRARERVRDYLTYRQTAISDAERGPMRAVVIESDGQGRADTLAALLQRNGITVQRLRANAESPSAVEYGMSAAPGRFAAGAYVVDLAQPQGRLARALLEPDAQLDSSFIAEELENRRNDQGDRFYDLTAWSMPYAYRVRASWTRTAVGPLEPASIVRPTAPALANATYGYAFEPGSEASIAMLSRLLADSVRLWFAPRSFRTGDARFPAGAFVVRTAANTPRVHDLVRAAATATGARVVPLATAAMTEGADLGSNSVFPIRIPKVALLGGDPISGQSFGYAWYAFDHRLQYPVTTIPVSVITGAGLDDFNVLVVPSVSAAGLNGALGESGRQRLGAWVRNGGVVVALDGAMSWLATEATGLARIRARRDTTTRADSTSGGTLPTDVPGAIVRVVGDSLSPLMAGVRDRTFPALVFSDRIYTAPRDFRAGEVVVRYEAQPRLRLAGYLWPEVPARIAGTPYLWTERVGRGRVIGFAGDPTFRDMFRGLLPLFANAVFLGGSF